MKMWRAILVFLPRNQTVYWRRCCLFEELKQIRGFEVRLRICEKKVFCSETEGHGGNAEMASSFIDPQGKILQRSGQWPYQWAPNKIPGAHWPAQGQFSIKGRRPRLPRKNLRVAKISMPVKRKRGRSRPGAFAGAVGLAANAYNLYRSRSRTNTKRRATTSAPAPITGESDWRNLYRKKRFPARRKKQWKRFSRKVKFVLAKTLAPQFNVIVTSTTLPVNAGLQGYTDIFTVLGGNGTSNTADISYLFDRALATIIPNTTIGGQTKGSLKLIVTGWLAEVVIVNYGVTLAYLDCYYWKTKRDYIAEGHSVGELWDNSLGNVDPNVVGTATETTITSGDYGVTPFQGTTFAKHCVVWKKTRIKLPSGGTCQMELKSGKEYHRAWSYDQDFSLLRGCTEGILFVQYGAPTEALPITSGTGLRYTVNKNFTWRVAQDNRMKGMHDLP